MSIIVVNEIQSLSPGSTPVNIVATELQLNGTPLSTSSPSTSSPTLPFTAGPGVSEGTWCYFDTADSKVKPLIAVSNTDAAKVVGVVVTTGVINDGDSVEVLASGIWTSSTPLSGTVGDRYLSTTVAGAMQDTVPSADQSVFLGRVIATNDFLISIGRVGANVADFPTISADTINSYTGGQPVDFPENIKTDEISESTTSAGVTFNHEIHAVQGLDSQGDISTQTNIIAQGDVNVTGVLRTDKIQTNSGTTFFGKRQVIIEARKGKTYADFIEPSITNTATAKASISEPIIVSIANGFDGFGRDSNYLEKITSDVAFTGLTTFGEAYLGVERVAENTVSQVVTYNQPVYDSVFGSDRENKLCATFDGTINDTTFTDFYGNTVHFSTANASIQAAHPSGSGNSLRLAGTTGQCTVGFGNSKIAPATLTAWTIEFWFKLDTVNTGSNQFILCGDTEYLINIYKLPGDATSMNVDIGNGGGWQWTSGAFSIGTLTNGIWFHFALVAEGNAYKVYLDGTLRQSTGTFAYGSGLGTPQKIILGNHSNSSGPMTGNISNLAFWPYAKYAYAENTLGNNAFTPSSANLTADTAVEDRFWRNQYRFSADLATAAVNSTYFRETYGNYLTFRHTSAGSTGTKVSSVTGPGAFGTVKVFDFATSGNGVEVRHVRLAKCWAMESFVYFNAGGGIRTIFDTRFIAQYSVHVRITAANQLELYLSSNGSSWNIAGGTAGSTLSYSTWYHIALCFDGTSYKVYVDGVLDITVNSELEVMNNGWLTIGGHYLGSGENLNGYMFLPSLYPYCKYTANFSVPVAAPAVENNFYYDIVRAKMYEGYAGNWTETPTIFLGEAFTNERLSPGVQTISYSLNGETFIPHLSGRYSPSETGASGVIDPHCYHVPHNIGTTQIDTEEWTEALTQYDLGAVYTGQRFKLEFYQPAGPHSLPSVSIKDRNYLILSYGAGGHFIAASNNGTAVSLLSSDGGMGNISIRVRRNF